MAELDAALNSQPPGGVANSEVAELVASTPEALFRQSYSTIVRSLALAAGDVGAAEDATQEAFAEAWARWGRISKYDNPGAWVRRVAINKLRNNHRSHLRKQAALVRLAAEADDIGPTEPDTSLIAALQALPLKQRLATVLHYVDGLTAREVATAMGVSEGSVNQHLNRARNALRRALEDPR